MKTEELVTADYAGNGGGWGDDNPSVFSLSISGKLQGEYQLTNGYGPLLAPSVMQVYIFVTTRPVSTEYAHFNNRVPRLGTLEHIHSRRRFQIHKEQWTQRCENPSRVVDC